MTADTSTTKRKIKVRAVFCASKNDYLLLARGDTNSDAELLEELENLWDHEPGEAIAFLDFEVDVVIPGIPSLTLERVTVEQAQAQPLVAETK